MIAYAPQNDETTIQRERRLKGVSEAYSISYATIVLIEHAGGYYDR